MLFFAVMLALLVGLSLGPVQGLSAAAVIDRRARSKGSNS